MRKFIVFMAACLVLTFGISAVGTFEYILPTEYGRIEFDSFYVTGRRIIALDENEKVAAYDLKGDKLTKDYDSLYFNDHGMGVGKLGDTYEIINYNGQVVGTFGKEFISLSNNFVFIDLGNNNDGRPIFYYEGEFAICDYQGNRLKVLPYDGFVPDKNAGYGLTFDSSRLVFEENGKFGALDHGFNVAIKPEYDKIYAFTADSYSVVAVKDGKHGIIDYDGNILTPFAYDYIEPITDNGYLKCYKVQIGNKYGVVASDGKTVMMEPCEYEIANVFYDYSLVKVSIDNTREDKDEYPKLYGLVDFSGNLVLPIEHTNIYDISDGIIKAQKSYDHSGYYDLFGNEITEFKYRMVSNYAEGYAFASSCIDGVWTHEVIDTDGKVVFNPENWSQGFNNGIAYIENGKFVDTTGKVVFTLSDKVTTSYSSFGSTEHEGFFTVTDGNRYGVVKYIPEKSVPLWEFEYIDFYGEVSTIAKRDGGYVFSMKDGTERYFDLKGRPTDNKVLVYGTCIFNEGDTVEIRDTENDVMMTLKEGEYKQIIEGEQEIAIVYDNSVMIVSRSPACERIVYDWSLEETAGLAEFYLGNIGQYYCKENDGKYYILGSRTPYELVWFLDKEFAAKRDGGWYVVDADGNELNKEPFASKPDVYTDYTGYYIVGSKIYNKNFELLLDLGERYIQNIVNENYLIVSGDEMNELGVVNIKGETVIEPAIGDITYLGDDMFKVYRGGLFAVVHASGRVLASGCTHVTDIGDNGYVGISKRGFEGYIDNTGKVKITLPHGYYVQDKFSGGMAPVVQNIIYGRYGDTSYINEDGDIVLESNNVWCYGGDFENKLAFVYTNLGKAGPLGKRLVKCVYNNPSDWAGETVLIALDKGLIEYENPPLYRKNITREGFCEIVYNLPAVKTALASTTAQAINFTDTDSEAVKALSTLGVIYGKGNGKFAPDAYITREEVATILDRVYRLGGKSVTPDGYTYADDSAIADWAKESVYNMRAAGIMLGMGDDKFSPHTMCTAEQTVAAALRLY